MMGASDRTGRIVARMRDPRARIALTRDGCAFGVFSTGDQRRRPALILSRVTLQALLADGLLEQERRGVYRLSAAFVTVPFPQRPAGAQTSAVSG
jgi:hypothetical protein